MTKDKFIPQAIQDNLKTYIIGRPIFLFDTLDSTNDFALSLEGPAEGTVVLAEDQAKGKGRFGRQWVSAPGQAILASVILKPSSPVSDQAVITLLASLAIARTIREETGLGSVIRWPNDVCIRERKVCGILTERKAARGDKGFLVLGFGVNVNQTREAFPRELRKTATSLRIEKKKKVPRLILLRRLLENIERYYTQFNEKGFRPFLKEWVSLSATVGSQVNIEADGRTLSGMALGIDEDGGLLLRLDSGIIRKVHAGEVRHLRMEEGK